MRAAQGRHRETLRATVERAAAAGDAAAERAAIEAVVVGHLRRHVDADVLLRAGVAMTCLVLDRVACIRGRHRRQPASTSPTPSPSAISAASR